MSEDIRDRLAREFCQVDERNGGLPWGGYNTPELIKHSRYRYYEYADLALSILQPK